MIIPGAIAVTGFIGPTDSTDVYAVTDSIYGVDGLRNVPDYAGRDAIPVERRRQGMLVGTQNDNKYWSLNASPWNFDSTDWSLAIDLGSGPVLEMWESIGNDIQTSTSLGSPAIPNILPAYNNQQDIGSLTKKWKDLYTDAIYLGAINQYDIRLGSAVLTGNQMQTFQDASGVIALLSNIPASLQYIEEFSPGTLGIANIITHNLGTVDLIVQLWEGNKLISADEIEVIDYNNVNITFTGFNPGVGSPSVVKVTIIGLTPPPPAPSSPASPASPSSPASPASPSK